MGQTCTVTVGNTNVTSLLVTDLTGKQVRRITDISGEQIKFERNNLSTGIYLIHLLKDQQILQIQRLVVN